MRYPDSRLLRFAAALAICALLGSAHTHTATPQGAAQRFRTGVTSVEVDAIVTDGEGRFVPSLRAEDFELFEDGRSRPISAFTLVQAPDASVTVDPLESTDTRSNERVAPGRVFVLVLDDLHTATGRGAVQGPASPTDRASRTTGGSIGSRCG